MTASQPITTLALPWPRYPTVTPGGKVSAAKNAGHLLPWLSMNIVDRMQPRVHHYLKALWSGAAEKKFSELAAQGRMADEPPYYLDVLLCRPRAATMDVLGIGEGCKPIIDGAVRARVLPDDHPGYVCGLLRGTVVRDVEHPGAVISLVPASRAADWLATVYGYRPETYPQTLDLGSR